MTVRGTEAENLDVNNWRLLSVKSNLSWLECGDGRWQLIVIGANSKPDKIGGLALLNEHGAIMLECQPTSR